MAPEPPAAAAADEAAAAAAEGDAGEAKAPVVGPGVVRHERLEWKLPEDETQARFRRAMLQSGAKAVEQLLQDGAPLHVNYELSESTGSGNALDLAMQSKRFKLAEKLLKLEEDGMQLARGSARAVAWAARDGRLNLLQELLQHQADATQRDESGTPAVLLAASRGHTDCAEVLVEAGALGPEEAAGVEQLERLEFEHLMAEWKAKRALQAAAAGEPPEPPEPRWSNAPHRRLPWATEEGRSERGARGCLEQAVAQGSKKDVLQLLQAAESPVAELDLGDTGARGTALDLAVLRKRFHLASQLLAEPCGDTLARASAHAVAWAAKEGRSELLRELLRRGANPLQVDERGRSALLLAATRGHGRCVDVMLEFGAWEQEGAKEQVREWAAQWRLPLPPCKGNEPGQEPVPRPRAVAGTPRQLPAPPEEAREAKARKAAAVRWSNTPHERKPWYTQGRGEVIEPPGALELAIASGTRQDVERLLSSGESALGECGLGEGLGRGTLLDLAMQRRRFRIAMQILGGVDGRDLARSSRWALPWAAQEGQLEVLQELLRHQADIEQCDERGRSPLLLAASRGHGRCVYALLDAGAWLGEPAPDEVRVWAEKWHLSVPQELLRC